MMMKMPSTRSRGFTLLEIIVAMGILAIGATTALALLVAAASTGRRAEHHVNAALLADSVIAELATDVTLDFKAEDSPPCDRTSFQVDDVASAPSGPPRTRERPPSPSPSPAKSPKPDPGRIDPGMPNAGGLDLREIRAPVKSYLYKQNAVFPGYPDYKYDVVISPCGGPPDNPWEFFVEVFVRWNEKSVKRQAVYETVVLRRVCHLDNEAPPQPK